MEQRIQEFDVRTMNREELLNFFYNYINTGKYIEKHYSSVSKRLEENRKRCVNELKELDRKYNDFYINNLSYNETKAKKKLLDKRFSRKNSFTLESIPMYVKILFVLLPILLFGISNSITVVSMIVVLAILAIILSFIFPIFLFIPVILAGIFAVLYKVFSSVFKVLIEFVGKVYTKYTMKQAHRKDILAAKRKGITKDNIKEVFKYEQIRSEINYKYNELEKKIKSWNFEEKDNYEILQEQLSDKLPSENRKLEYVIYMYNQLVIGANDNWKESINDLKLQLRHDELKNELRQISNNIIQSNNQLAKMNHDINRRVSELDKMISHESRRLDARMDGFFNHLEYY